MSKTTGSVARDGQQLANETGNQPMNRLIGLMIIVEALHRLGDESPAARGMARHLARLMSGWNTAKRH